ncbi:MAG: oligopeptide/dipeptide ABC transporter ATP-binding protein [Halolamina sp.]|uniref:oligopeptide/dipeptide ABC transporter ATP-binding protein n=1 Tax=Halolamina sp. TaxID=1940283 RepID=UPI002FC3C855
MLSGAVPSPRNPPSGCRFHTRCRHAREICKEEKPPLVTDESESAEHESMCFRNMPDHQYWQSPSLEEESQTAGQQPREDA